MASRAKSKQGSEHRTHPRSHTPFAALSTDEKTRRLYRLSQKHRQTRQQMERLQSKIYNSACAANVPVDDALDQDLRSLAAEHQEHVVKKYPVSSFQRVFWEQQVEASVLNNSKPMRWHPLFIKWCLYLRHLSVSAYEMVRESGCVQLPSQHSLRDYTHHISSEIGFSSSVDKYLREMIEF